MVKKLQTSLVVFLCVFSILYGSEEEPKRRIFFTASSKYPESDFRRWARPKTIANISLEPGEPIPSGYVLSAGTPSGYTRYVTKKLPISTKEELYNQFISGYGPSDEQAKKDLRLKRSYFGNSSGEEARKELAWALEENYRTGRFKKLLNKDQAFLKKVEQQTPESYVKPRKVRSLFSSYESPSISSSSTTPKTGFWTKFLTWVGWYKPTYTAPQSTVSESLKPFKSLQQVSE